MITNSNVKHLKNENWSHIWDLRTAAQPADKELDVGGSLMVYCITQSPKILIWVAFVAKLTS